MQLNWVKFNKFKQKEADIEWSSDTVGGLDDEKKAKTVGGDCFGNENGDFATETGALNSRVVNAAKSAVSIYVGKAKQEFETVWIFAKPRTQIERTIDFGCFLTIVS